MIAVKIGRIRPLPDDQQPDDEEREDRREHEGGESGLFGRHEGSPRGGGSQTGMSRARSRADTGSQAFGTIASIDSMSRARDA